MDNHRGDVPIVPNTFKEIETLSESQLCRVFPEYHIVTTTRRDEYNCCNVVKALYPFSPFVALTTDVEHTAKRRWRKHVIKCFTNTSKSFDSQLSSVLIVTCYDSFWIYEYQITAPERKTSGGKERVGAIENNVEHRT